MVFKDVENNDILLSMTYILNHHLPINDALHLYSALDFRPTIQEFICSDTLLNQVAEKEGLTVIDPES